VDLSELLAVAHRGERTLVMGILNITPDSFSDGGRFLDVESAVQQERRMVDEGADIIDVGGESTRPGAAPLPVEEELQRVIPVIRAISESLAVLVSIDTYKAAAAREAVTSGAAMVNDISALTFDPDMAPAIAEMEVPVCLMHIKGTPRDMQQNPVYEDVVREVRDWLAERAAFAEKSGIRRENILLDPGFGFGKRPEHNLELLRRLREIVDLGYPVLSGWSRKSTIGRILGGLPPDERLEGTAATVALSIANGAGVVRVHDVKEMVRVARMTDAVVRGWTESG
jgi:dihydropteroate synthase